MSTPFKIQIPDSVLENITQRVAAYPWDSCYMPDDGSWNYGTNLDYLKSFCQYWLNEYDWRQQESILNRYEHFMHQVNGCNIHYMKEQGSGSSPKPLLLVHGWPGSISEFLHVVDKLAHPEQFGGNEEDAFTVIMPSLPGFVFSERPARPMGPRAMGTILNALMVDLGYTSYITQGGDWGSAICSWIAYDHNDHCKALHFNFPTMRHYKGAQTSEEQDWLDSLADEQIMNDGYRTQQATKPQSLAYAMADSPVGVAAWLLDKFMHWSETVGTDIESAHSKDDLLTNIMLYLVSHSFNSSTWIYYGRREEGGRFLITDEKTVTVPTGCALYPAEMMSWPPRSYYERMYNITHWNTLAKGGHFAAMEVPDIWIEDFRIFARTINL